MVSNMSAISVAQSGLCFKRLIGLPQLDRIALWIMNACEAPDARHIPFRVGGHSDPRRAERRAQGVEIFDAQVEHPLAIRSEIIRVGCERREDTGPRQRLPRAVGRRAHAEMFDIPGDLWPFDSRGTRFYSG